MMRSLMNPVAALEKYFGFPQFREGQEEIVDEILDGRDVLVIMPTGGGKSLCYQLPALMRPGVTLVVSPLIALMKDQVDSLCGKNIPAGYINSTLSLPEQRARMRAMENGELKLVYVAPERFRHEGFLRSLSKVEISLFAVDEAHCISQWGHDFRPDYYRMGQVVKDLKTPQVLALTATATPAVRDDILRSLSLRDPKVFVAGFSRPNLSLRVRQVANEIEKFSRLQDLVARYQTGIIYCATRKKVEAVAVELAEWGVSHIAYHAGMEEVRRTAAQEKFLRGEARVAVATNAFGMGIDRADLRFVAHFEIPGSIEAYYQEVGRAGRDGADSVCELLFMHPDVRVQEFFIEGSNPGPEIIRGLWNALRGRMDSRNEVQLSIADMADLVDGCKNDMGISSALATLGRAGYLERFDIPGKTRRGTRLLRTEVTAGRLEINWKALEEKESLDRERLRQMIDYAYSKECRQQFILRAFGEENSPACGVCDRCLAAGAHTRRAPRPGEVILMQKILSCVARMSWRRPDGWVGRFGRQRIAQVLTGSKARPVLDAGLDKLSTYGLLAEMNETMILELLREAIAAGLLKVEPGTYPVISLTPQGESAMRGLTNYMMVWPGERGSARTAKKPAKEHPKKANPGKFGKSWGLQKKSKRW